jgi:putative spermidine/putrescine transport system substrate-binding protein
MAWNTEQRYGPGAGPKTWEEFYDGDKFPGRIALRSAAFRTLPGAAMAAGIAPADLYPLDLDAAFDTLSRVKDRVVKWSDASQAHQELALAGETDLLNLYTSRCVILKRNGDPIDFTFDQGSAEDADMVIMKASPNREQAMAYLQVWFNTPEAHKAFSELTLLGFTNKLGIEMVDPALKPLLSTAPENAAKFAPAGNSWWAEHTAEAEQRMAEFILS